MIRSRVVFTLAGLLSVQAFAQIAPTENKVSAQVAVSPQPGPAVQSPAPELSGDQGVVTLDDLVREALQRNPGVQSTLHAVEEQRRRVPSQDPARSDGRSRLGWQHHTV